MRRPAVWLSLALLALSVALISYRVGWLKYSVLPTAPGHAWQLAIEARIKPDHKEITAMIALPSEHTGRTLIEERTSSGTLNFSLIQEGSNRIGIWSGAAGPEEETITYRSTVLIRPQRTPRVQLPTLTTNLPPITKEEQELIGRLALRWSGLAPVERFRAVAGAAEGKWGAMPPDSLDIEAWKTMEEKEGRLAAVLSLFRAAGLPAHSVEGFRHVERK